MTHLLHMKYPFSSFLLAVFFLVAGLGPPTPGYAQSPGQVISVRVLPGWQQRDGSFVVGLAMDLAPGWKTYWRAPGDAGIPPRVDWAGSRNIGALQMMWPTPHVMDQNGMTSIGYHTDLVVPVVLRARSEGSAMTIRGTMHLGVCREICVPAKVKFEAVLPAGKGQRDAAIVAALVDQPLSAKDAGLRKLRCRVAPTADGLRLRAEITMPSAGGTEHAVVETDNPSIWVAEARSHRKGKTLVAETEMVHVDGKPFALNRAGVRITVLGRDHAVDIRGCPAG